MTTYLGLAVGATAFLGSELLHFLGFGFRTRLSRRRSRRRGRVRQRGHRPSPVKPRQRLASAARKTDEAGLAAGVGLADKPTRPSRATPRRRIIVGG
ncbi:MAG: hypothetical protein ACI8TP_000734 [Acidimicrobiales bacterium]|jgi:hypothetical protein